MPKSTSVGLNGVTVMLGSSLNKEINLRKATRGRRLALKKYKLDGYDPAFANSELIDMSYSKQLVGKLYGSPCEFNVICSALV